MHPELNLPIAMLRHEELTSARRFPTPLRPRTNRRGFFFRRRDTPAAGAVQPATIVLLPPPREERDPAGHDQRVA